MPSESVLFCINKDCHGGFEIKISKEAFEIVKSAVCGELLTELMAEHAEKMKEKFQSDPFGGLPPSFSASLFETLKKMK